MGVCEMAVNVRLATVEDTRDVVTMALRFIRETSYNPTLCRATYETLAVVFQLALDHGACYVAVDEHPFLLGHAQDTPGPRLVGFIAAVALTHPLTGELFADEIAWWMEPEHRGSRAAYQMLRALMDWCGQIGVPTLKMIAPAGSQIGTFYERMGFTAVETAYQLRLDAPDQRLADGAAGR